jgi:site-specific recombinase XerD
MARRPVVVAPQGRTALDALVDDYLASCRARGLSRSTVQKNYGYSLREVFLPWAAKAGITEIDQLDQRLLDRFTADLLDSGGRHGQLSRHTAHSYIRPVRQCLAWAHAQGDISSSVKPQLPRLPRRVIDVLSRDDIARLEAVAATERDKLIVRTLADTGLRAGELCGLRVDDLIRHDRGALLRVRGKGGKERLVPLRPEMARRIDRFVRARPAKTRTDHLFLSLRRRADGEYQPVTGSGVGQMLDVLADRAGITKRVYPHLLRHSFATEALRRGMNPIQLAQILGHSGLQMIDQVYSHLTATDAYDAMMRMLATE